MIDPTIEEIVPNCELAGGEGLGVMVQTPNQFFTTKNSWRAHDTPR